jgi:hypothetical protein
MKNKILIYGVLLGAAYVYYRHVQEKKRSEELKADSANGESTSNACGCSNASGRHTPSTPVSSGGW